MYFCVGGRGGQSYLFRVAYTGGASTELSRPDTTSVHAKARATRRMIEKFHGKPNPKALQEVWDHLGSKDYHIRYAARIAMEWQDPKSWPTKAYSE